MSGGFNYISLVSLEAVSEVQVTKGIVPAEYAPTMSGNFNVITQSGSNRWHGSVFVSLDSALAEARAHASHPDRARVLRFQSAAPGSVDIIEL